MAASRKCEAGYSQIRSFDRLLRDNASVHVRALYVIRSFDCVIFSSAATVRGARTKNTVFVVC